MDKIVPQLGEPRICPNCQRWVKFWKDQYLCTDCWILLSYEETLKHPHPEGLCTFVVSQAEVGVHFTCMTCSKSFLVSHEDVSKDKKEKDLLFSREHVEVERLAREMGDRQIGIDIEALKRKDQQVKELFIQFKQASTGGRSG